MFLRSPPGNWTVLRLLGPWPWYIPGAAIVAAVLLVVLDSPFRAARQRPDARQAAGNRRIDLPMM